MSLKISPRGVANAVTPPKNKNGHESQNSQNSTPQFRPDPEYCAVEHDVDSVYDRPASKSEILENIRDLRYSQNAKKAFIYSEILGRPLSQRRRT